ncbi:MAG: dienelactone hydrolase family protein [Candidatus Thermoplasmatota archaeon]|jgi:carboxymethylenebutenolidase|nr:dienelactone hydrolase family protein [Candidatus Thermoplasmatota archaeon]
MEITTKMKSYRTFDGSNLDFFEAKPVSYNSTVIVVSEIWGLSAFIKSFSRRLAEEGYRVISPDLYSRPSDRNIFTEENIMDAMRPMWSLPPEKRRDEEAIRNVKANLSENGKKIFEFVSEKRVEMEKRMLLDLEWIYKDQKEEGKKIGIVGFCMGGGLAFQLSTQLKFDASMIFYGASPRNIEDMKNISGALLCVYAGEDGGINATIKDVAEMVSKHKLDFEMKMYPGTYHAFFNDTGMSYNREASEDAWERLKRFYRRYLK